VNNGGITRPTKEARAAAALFAAFDVANADNLIASDRAWGLATEALNRDTSSGADTGVNWGGKVYVPLSAGPAPTAWRGDRLARANDVRAAFDPKTTGLNIVKDLAARYASPPPWAKNTGHMPKDATPAPTYGIQIPAAQSPPGSWSLSKLDNYWDADGTDDGNFTSRNAWISDTNGNVICTGTYYSPVSPYTWGYHFSGLTIGQTVNINVQWNYTTTGNVAQSVTCVVAGAS
jgi:hypothetical protein